MSNKFHFLDMTNTQSLFITLYMNLSPSTFPDYMPLYKILRAFLIKLFQ